MPRRGGSLLEVGAGHPRWGQRPSTVHHLPSPQSHPGEGRVAGVPSWGPESGWDVSRARWLATNALGCAEGPGCDPRPRCPEFPEDLGPRAHVCQTRGPLRSPKARASDPVSMARSPAPVRAPQGDARQPGVGWRPRGAARVTYLRGHARPAAQNCRPTASVAQKAVGASRCGRAGQPSRP